MRDVFNEDYIELLGSLKTNSRKESYIKKRFPDMHLEISKLPGPWSQKIYMYVNRLQNEPTCPVCGEKCAWNRHSKTFYKTCGSKECCLYSVQKSRFENKTKNISQQDIDKYILFKENSLAFNRNKSLYTIWRSKVGTKKAKQIGFDPTWNTFEGFINNIPEGYKTGYVLIRKNTSLPCSKNNCVWAPKGAENLHNTIKIPYKGKQTSLRDIALAENLSYYTIKNRYFNRSKYHYNTEEIIFGRKKIKKQKPRDPHDLEIQAIKNKACSMLTNYKLRDIRRGLKFDISKDYMINIMLHGRCFYCGTTKKLGLDRLDNTKGHTPDNVVPCCYECNVARNDSFTVDEMKILGDAIKTIRKNRGETII